MLESERVFLDPFCADQAVLETVARVKPKKNDTKEEKYMLLPLCDCNSHAFLMVKFVHHSTEHST